MVYIDNIYWGMLIFPLIAAAITLPYALHQYHKYGSVSKYRTIIIYSFILYMLIALFMVVLPLPEWESTIGNRWQDHLNLIPFRQVWLYWHHRPINPETIMEYARSMSLWQLLFNILLTMPFGVYLHYYFKQDLKRTILFSFLLSLFYETSQLTALFGLYPGPYRQADVEDLICNTLGGAVGYQIAYVFMEILPSRDQIDRMAQNDGRRVSGLRRMWADVFDLMCSSMLYSVICGGIAFLTPDMEETFANGAIYDWTFYCLFSLVQVLMTGGVTLGHAICRMTLVSDAEARESKRLTSSNQIVNGRASAGQLIKRYLYLWLFTDLPLIIVNLIADAKFEFINSFMILGLLLLSRAYFIAYFIFEVFRKEAVPMPHDRLSGTTYRSLHQ